MQHVNYFVSLIVPQSKSLRQDTSTIEVVLLNFCADLPDPTDSTQSKMKMRKFESFIGFATVAPTLIKDKDFAHETRWHFFLIFRVSLSDSETLSCDQHNTGEDRFSGKGAELDKNFLWLRHEGVAPHLPHFVVFPLLAVMFQENRRRFCDGDKESNLKTRMLIKKLFFPRNQGPFTA